MPQNEFLNPYIYFISICLIFDFILFFFTHSLIWPGIFQQLY
jgi:hypothetical protein